MLKQRHCFQLCFNFHTLFRCSLSTVTTRFQFSRKQNGGLESSETTVTRFSKCGTNFIANRVQDTSNPGMGS